MSDIFCVTNRKLCRGDYLARLEEIADSGAAGIILREKDLSAVQYEALARLVLDICRRHNMTGIIHGNVRTAYELEAPALHVSMPLLRRIPKSYRKTFRQLGASCHTVEEAKEAENLDCTYIIAGHIFDTDCKAGLPGRGLDFLREVKDTVSIPVSAIGGITPENVASVREAGADGICIMSGFMECENVKEYIKRLS